MGQTMITRRSFAEWFACPMVLATSLLFTAVSEPAEEPNALPPMGGQRTASGQAPKRLEVNGDILGVMTLAEFHRKYADAKVKGPLVPSSPFDNVQGCQQFEVRGEPYGMKIATFPVYNAHFQFLDGVLLSVRLSVHQKDPNGLIAAELTKKHGEPRVEDQDFIGTIRTWNNGTSGIQLMGKLPNATFSDNALQKKYDQRLETAMRADMEAQKKRAQTEKK